MKFNGLKLDKFQEDAIKHIEENKSVVVSAATGTGKTLIADYVIDKYLKEKKRIIYTAPIKALSNQKYRDFKKQYGEENVGILTGDVTINHDAPLRIMTTEIYRNMLLAKDPEAENIAYTIFDEIHYLGDIERGTVWEESIIFSHPSTRFVCLSATIPNAKQFANWISYIKKHDVELVVQKKRAVPLHQSFYEIEQGFLTLKELKELKELDRAPRYFRSKKHKQKYLNEITARKKVVHVDLISELKSQKKLPCIYFSFSRADTQNKAYTLAKRNNFLTNEEQVESTNYIREKLKDADHSVKGLETTRTLRECLSKGVGFHHAGILPTLKEIVEELFSRGLLKVLFATETFAVGINMPAKTVCFNSLDKFDGINFRYLNSKEYFQLAGRAGRRGIDKEGFVVCVVEAKMTDVKAVERITLTDKDPLRSQFKLSFNTILNLIHSHEKEEQKIILNSSLFTYQEAGRTRSNRIVNSFEKKKKKLFKENYIINGELGEELTEKGLFAMKIYLDDLIVSEIFCSHEMKYLTNPEILLLVARIVYEEKKNTKFEIKSRQLTKQLFKHFKKNKKVRQFLRDNPTHIIEQFTKSWYEGCDFVEVLEFTNMPEGDVVRFIRQMLDLLEQIRHATLDYSLKEKIKEIKERIDRDVISVRF
ncbi:MAG: DEAD/DEAH box helicase [Candidatus Woesearchaeota archaeon]